MPLNMSLYTAAEDQGECKPKVHALIKDKLLLSDTEVTLSFMKFILGVAILNFPAQASHLGVLNGILATILISALIAKSNENLVKAIPIDMMK